MGTENKNNNNNDDSSSSSTTIMLIDQPCSTPFSSLQQQPSRKHDTYTIISLPEPNSGHPRDYLLLPSSHIYEIQSLSPPISSSCTGPKTCDKQKFTETYNSYFVSSSRIVQQKEVKLGTRVDPLYFILGILERRNGQKHRWQPLDQIMEGIPQVLLNALLVHPPTTLDAKKKVTPEKENSTNDQAEKMQQLHHFFQTDDTIDDEEIYYKFSMEKVKTWLLSKHAKLTKIVSAQLLHSKKLKQKMEKRLDVRGKGSGGDGAFNTSFHLGNDDDDDNRKETNADNHSTTEDEKKKDEDILELSNEETKMSHLMTFQFLSEYLTDDMALTLKQELKLEDVTTKKKTPSKSSGGSPSTSSLGSAEAARVTPSPSVLVDTDDEEECNNAGNGNSRKRLREDENNETPSSSSWEGALPGEKDRDQLLQYTMGCGGGGSGLNDGDEVETLQKKKKLNQAQSVGLKKLAKVNTKGMKSIASFFGGGGGNKNKKKKVC